MLCTQSKSSQFAASFGKAGPSIRENGSKSANSDGARGVANERPVPEVFSSLDSGTARTLSRLISFGVKCIA